SASVTRASCSTRSACDGAARTRVVNSAFALQLMRFAFLVLLWLFVLATIRVIRSDLRTTGQPRIAVPPPARRRGRGNAKNAGDPNHGAVAGRARPGPSQPAVTAGR